MPESVNPTPTLDVQRSPLAELLSIAMPVVATMTSYTAMQFVDKLMVSRIGPEPVYVGAQGNGGFLSWIAISVAMGTLTIINTFVSQHLGAKSPEKSPAYCWAGCWAGLAYWLVVLIPFGLALPTIFSWSRAGETDPAALATMIWRDRMSAEYAQVLLYGAIITLMARSVQNFFYGMHKPSVILVASVLGNIVNLLLNVFFVYGPKAPAATGIAFFDGWFGFCAELSHSMGLPAMGVKGSAIATLVGTSVEAIIPLAVFLSPKYNRLYHTRAAWRPDFAKIRELIKVGWPAGAMLGNEMVCWGMFMVFQVGHFGTSHSTAGWITHQWMAISFMPSYGISVAITSSVGKCLGMGRPDLAEQRAWLGLRLAVVWMSFCAIVFFVFRNQLIALFIESNTPEPEAKRIMAIGAGFLIATAAFQFFDGFAMSISGALRGAGDTKWPGVFTLILSWTIIVGGGWAFVLLAPGMSSLGPWIAAATYIVLLAVVLFWRFRLGHWKSIKLISQPAPAAA